MLDTKARHLVQPLFQWVARKLSAIGLTANQVTWIAFIVGVSTGPLIYFDYWLAALMMLWLSGFLDAVDGTMARLSGTTSPWGTLLDMTFDRIVELTVIVALALHVPHAGFPLLVLTASIVVAMTVFLTVGALSEKQKQAAQSASGEEQANITPTQTVKKSFYYQPGLAERTEGFVLLSFMIMFQSQLIWLTWLFIVLEWFTIFQRLREARRFFR